MVIKSSAARHQSAAERAVEVDDIRREAAVARLAVIGARAVGHLLEALGADPPAPTRVAILRALEAIGDRRALPALERLTDSDPRTALAAVAVACAFLTSDDRAAARTAFEGLTALALDRTRPAAARMAAVEALDEVPGSSSKTLREQLRNDPASSARRVEPARQGGRAKLPADRWRRCWAGCRTIPMPCARRCTRKEHQRPSRRWAISWTSCGREKNPRRAEERAAWRTARGAVHRTLSARNSRVALYDLRETLADASEPLPVGFVAAIEVIGDQSCLGRWRGRGRQSQADAWWRGHLESAFRAIMKRAAHTPERRAETDARALAAIIGAGGCGG